MLTTFYIITVALKCYTNMNFRTHFVWDSLASSIFRVQAEELSINVLAMF
jgi:hypothetical protein